jgi:hypothetical protein
VAKAEQLRKARRAEVIRKLRQLQRRNAISQQQQQRAGKAAAAASSGNRGKLSRAEVGEPDVANIISTWTGQYAMLP